MKRLLAIIFVLSFALLTSCGADTPTNSTSTSSEATEAATTATETTEPAVISKTPADEIPTRKVFRNNDGGMLLEITVNGYKSESLGLDFYVKNTEFITGILKVTRSPSNFGTGPQVKTTYIELSCFINVKIDGERIYHDHNFWIGLEDKTGKSMSRCSPDSNIHECWQRRLVIGEGTSFERHFFLVAGESEYDDFDKYSEEDNTIFYLGKNKFKVDLYDDIYTDGKCTFEGTGSFGYYCLVQSTKNEFPDTTTEEYVSCDISFTVLDCR